MDVELKTGGTGASPFPEIAFSYFETNTGNLAILDAIEETMERHEISTEKIDWPSLVRHVVRDRVVVELADGELPIAMLVPIEQPRTMADLDAALRKIPRLGEEAISFEEDLQKIRASMTELDDPWEF
jgi:hypothetical protein